MRAKRSGERGEGDKTIVNNKQIDFDKEWNRKVDRRAFERNRIKIAWKIDGKAIKSAI